MYKKLDNLISRKEIADDEYYFVVKSKKGDKELFSFKESEKAVIFKIMATFLKEEEIKEDEIDYIFLSFILNDEAFDIRAFTYWYMTEIRKGYKTHLIISPSQLLEIYYS